MVNSILFVCTANICRSPTAEGIFRRLLLREGIGNLQVESAATHAYMIGRPAFPSAVEHAKKRGYDLTDCISRQIRGSDFDDFDMIIAMDRSNVMALQSMAPTRCKQKIELLLDYSDKYHGKEVPDPYGGDDGAFERALDMIEDGCIGLVELLKHFRAGR
jgi:protein-tyrosine phosphatase